MTIGYSYIRFSSPAQMKGDSLRRQLAKSQRYADAHNLELDTSLRDEGLSGYKGHHRKKGQLAAFLRLVETGQIASGSQLIVENIDRLSRENPWDAMSMMRSIIEAGITVVSLVDDMVYSRETLTKRPDTMTVLQSALTKGHRESRDKADRLQDAWLEKRAQIVAGGERKLTRQGPAWLDFCASDPSDPLVGAWKKNGRADVVSSIYQMCIDGLGRGEIARRLNEEGVAAFRGGDGWQQSTVLFLLRDRRTIGELQLYSSISGTRQPVGEPICGYFPAVIEDHVYYAAQSALAARYAGAKTGSRRAVRNLFVGLARCSCGRTMEFRDRNAAKRSWRDKAIYLICSGAARRRGCTNMQRYTYSIIERQIVDWITDIKVSDEEASRSTIAGLKLGGKIAQRDDLKRRIEQGLERWASTTMQVIKDQLFAAVERDGRSLEIVEADIEKLQATVRDTHRSSIDDRRAAVARLRSQMAASDGGDNYELRAKLAAAVRAAVDAIRCDPDGSYSVTLKSGERSYRFAGNTIDIEWMVPPQDDGPPIARFIEEPQSLLCV